MSLEERGLVTSGKDREEQYEEVIIYGETAAASVARAAAGLCSQNL